MVKTAYIPLSTKGFCDMHDITDRISAALKESQLKNGIATIFVPGATGGLTTVEYEEGLIRDFEELMERVAPKDAFYHHNQRWHDGNGFSHTRAALLGCSITVPFTEGRLTLGTWQQVVFVDFDNKPRKRELICQLMGEA